ncbi:kinase phosphorylation protein-domain-containing protein [Exophiala viscosa]|uniref:Kinase phosphorylation protein-domain-containing protein n=1 Tax=Exophiala viscosa TaxID=2486360 RepID=A0AAN6ICA1_9EURO|nr:kinase phosphorylation protein-domain-containing protein [Exophiala viscosa]
MDLLATVRKEGSRGGLGDFKWSDVQNSSHREHYLGHSLMAPVGRWQKGRDLSWYAKPDEESVDGEDPAAKAARERKEEIRRVKEAEEDALARALGLPVAPRDNPNMQELGARREVAKVLKEAAEEDDTPGSRGVGHGRVAGIPGSKAGEVTTERLEGISNGHDQELQYALKEYTRRHGDRRHGSGSRDDAHERHRRHHRKHRDDDRRHRGHRNRSPDERGDRRRSRSASLDRSTKRDRRRGSRSRSPGRHRREDGYRRRDAARRDDRR